MPLCQCTFTVEPLISIKLLLVYPSMKTEMGLACSDLKPIKLDFLIKKIKNISYSSFFIMLIIFISHFFLNSVNNVEL